MATVKPFKAIRPTKDKAFYVASRSYEEYSKDELQAVLKYNPFSFLHIINPGFKFEKHITGQERFHLVRNRYLEFLEENIFQKDDAPSFYLYQIVKEDFKSLGFFCACSVEDYRNDVIKKHEDTLQEREELFADYLDTVGFNAEPVLMTYADNDEVNAIFQRKIKRVPEYDFTTVDRVNHKLWKISYPEGIEKLEKAFAQMDALYIADGHHRSASSDLLAKHLEKENSSHNGQEPYNYFMAYLIPESQMRIYEFNRMVKDLNGFSKKEFLIQLDEYFMIEKETSGLCRPTKKHEFCMYLKDEFYKLHLRKTNYQFTDALSELDTQILFKTILEPILGIKDLRNDKRISYGYGKHNLIKMKEDVDKGKFEVGFSLVPTTVEEIKAIADAGLVMPPKSTYIEPKLRSGLAIYEL
ncbi:DUF1015 domain-containing protein [Flagellimonas zhangzhouensis]|uniref:Uncharacterized conserved protein, DUF1015 family n=1 Tax=Flagellimonas zhangzhouensis TaxID=1073328 RepID=A0A1H2S3G8_9FLAO|nr:DUF1015 domain-containing protein [Allomuricauda zhangzhouensis]SDQ69713.1 Uncharacterized conserved protein, DUF1015 family [Allomuricauda zhangzhouensis]SDW25539.1 Uncharacterized conserved protein, DUF1015 family [Allomuricauda zhangzhouensis]